VLQIVLLVEFWDEQSDLWKKPAAQWEIAVFAFIKQLAAQLQTVRNGLRAGE
jgi:hypothetical protein